MNCFSISMKGVSLCLRIFLKHAAFCWFLPKICKSWQEIHVIWKCSHMNINDCIVFEYMPASIGGLTVSKRTYFPGDGPLQSFNFCVDQKSEMSDTTWQCLNIRPYMNKTLLKNYKLDWTQNCINKYTSTRLTLNTFTIPHCVLQAWTLLRMFHNQFNES